VGILGYYFIKRSRLSRRLFLFLCFAPQLGLLKKSFLTAKYTKKMQSTQSQNLMDQFFAIFAQTLATFAVNGFQLFQQPPVVRPFI
jgi:hypothetical protein